MTDYVQKLLPRFRYGVILPRPMKRSSARAAISSIGSCRSTSWKSQDVRPARSPIRRKRFFDNGQPV
jgi:hypothetical protein